MKRFAVLGILLAAVCGCGSATPSRSELEEALRAETEQYGESYGASKDSMDCLVEEALKEADRTDLLDRLTEENLGAEARSLGRAAGEQCASRPGIQVMIEDPSRSQADVALGIAETGIKAGFESAGLSSNQADCAFDGISASFSPREVAAVVNGEAVPKTFRSIVAKCAQK